MNFPKAFEGAMAAAITENNVLAELPRIRTWQAIDAEGRWTPAQDRHFPMIDIRGLPPMTDPDNGVTQLCALSIAIGTSADDDQDHTDVAEYYGAVQGVIDNLYAQFRSGTAGAERNSFDTYIENAEPAIDTIISIGGFSFGPGSEPYEEAGVNFIGMSYNIHYSRSDY